MVVEDVVTKILEPFLRQHKLELYDIEFVKEGSQRYLRVYVDKTSGIGVDDCERVSRFLSNALDRKDPIKENYFLEVSSPGAERRLRNQEDYKRYRGSLVEITFKRLQDGQKKIQGRLVDNSPSHIVIEKGKKGQKESFALEDIEMIKNKLEL